jgi:hypothetical protein
MGSWLRTPMVPVGLLALVTLEVGRIEELHVRGMVERDLHHVTGLQVKFVVQVFHGGSSRSRREGIRVLPPQSFLPYCIPVKAGLTCGRLEMWNR